MNILLSGVMIGVTVLSSAVASASIANWVNDAEQSPTSQRVVETTQPVASDMPGEQKPAVLLPNTHPVITESTPRIKPVTPTNKAEAVSTDVTASEHLDATSAFINNPSITALKTEDYMAIVLFNSALVQAGLEAKLKTSNQTTKGLFNSSVGCINSKKNESLNNIARKLIADHQKVVDLRSFMSSSATIGGTHTAKCL